MRLALLILALFSLVGCYDPSAGYYTEDDPDMIRQSRNPPVAPYNAHGIPQVVATIPRQGLWSGYNQLGYQAKYGPDDRGTQTILKLDEWGPPEVWTVSLYLKNQLKTYNGFSITARINFGAGGSTQVIEVDWQNGAQISLPMNAVNVEAIWQDVDIGSEGGGLSVGVQLSRGSRGGTEAPTFVISEDLSVPAASSSALFAIPTFAKRLVFIPTTNGAAGLAAFFNDTTRLFTLSGNDIGAIRTGENRGSRAVGGAIYLPVVGSARLCRIQNADGVSAIEGTLYAELDG